MTTPSAHTRPPSLGFTLIELLVAIGIIGLLVAIVSVVGVKAMHMQRESSTRGVLLTLDRALDEYKEDTGAFPKYDGKDYAGIPGADWAEPGDGANATQFAAQGYERYRGGQFFPRKPSAGVFFKQARGFADVDGITKSIPTQFIQSTPVQGDAAAVTVVDAWASSTWAGRVSGNQIPGRPALKQTYIVYVHPDNLLAQAYYGACVNGRPYFMSGGPDKKVGLLAESDPKYTGGYTETDEAYTKRIHESIADNIYSYPVGPYETDSDVFNRR